MNEQESLARIGDIDRIEASPGERTSPASAASDAFFDWDEMDSIVPQIIGHWEGIIKDSKVRRRLDVEQKDESDSELLDHHDMPDICFSSTDDETSTNARVRPRGKKKSARWRNKQGVMVSLQGDEPVEVEDLLRDEAGRWS